jgi:catechol 2,3-dioxygenase-like lactoylglutathione lyase family enzyme
VRLISRLIPILILVAAVGSAAAIVQTPAVVVLGTGSFTEFVENMDRSLAFFHDAFGMEVPVLPVTGERPYNRPNPQLFTWFNIVGAKERHQSARVTGTRVTVELMEIQDVPHQTMNLRIQDPGNATLVLYVRDLAATLARATKSNATIETPGGKPVALADGSLTILIRDIDHRFIELRQPSIADLSKVSPATDIFDMRLLLTVNDMDETTRVYRNVFGFTVDDERSIERTSSLTGINVPLIRRSRIQAPGSTLWIELIEFKGVDRTPLRMRIQDRGAARLQLRVQDVDAVVTAVKAAGLRIATESGVAVPIPPNLKGALVVDPNNFFLTPYAPCDGCAPTIAPVAPER